MILLKDATPEQRKVLLDIITEINLICNCLQHYNIEPTNTRLRIVERLENRPLPRRKQRLIKFMQLLERSGLLEFESKQTNILGPNGVLHPIHYISIKKLDSNRIDMLRDSKVLKAKPSDVNERLWLVLPLEIKENWRNFSEGLRAHILNCLNGMGDDIHQLYEGYVNTVVLGEDYRSPIGAGFPKIPVRLPNALLANGMSHEVYDLIEILKFEKREDPINRQAFNLNQIIPDPESMRQMKVRLENAKKKQEEDQKHADELKGKNENKRMAESANLYAAAGAGAGAGAGAAESKTDMEKIIAALKALDIDRNLDANTLVATIENKIQFEDARKFDPKAGAKMMLFKYLEVDAPHLSKKDKIVAIKNHGKASPSA